MKVIVAGFSKTGTKTMAAALRILGYNVFDFLEHFWYAGNEWVACMKKGEVDGLKRVYESVDAVCDAPAHYYWEELLEMFPDSKVVFMVRDEDSWLKSIANQIDTANSNFIHRLIPVCPTGFALHHFMNCIATAIFGTDPLWPGQSQTLFEKNARWTYRRHNASVLHRAPKDKLLIYDVKKGWEPLCKFLGAEVPDAPFPHKNKRGGMLEEQIKEHPAFQRIKTELTLISVGFSALFLTGCYMAYPHIAAFIKCLL